MTHVTVAIASCGRSSLADTLASLDAQIIPEHLTVGIVVADDSQHGAATRIVSQMQMDLPIHVVTVASGNVAKARNACLEAATGEYVAFIDDDEIAGPRWIDQFTKDAIATEADCLFAPVEPDYGPQAPAWIVALNPLFPSEVRTARRGDFVVGRTGNSLLKRSFLERHGLRFDVSFGAGIEDLHFFALCRAKNARMLTTERAVVHETVEPDRTRLAYVLKSCFARGEGYARVMSMTHQDGFTSSFNMALISTAKLVISGVLACVTLPLGQLRWVRFASSAASNLGKVAFLVKG